MQAGGPERAARVSLLGGLLWHEDRLFPPAADQRHASHRQKGQCGGLGDGKNLQVAEFDNLIRRGAVEYERERPRLPGELAHVDHAAVENRAGVNAGSVNAEQKVRSEVDGENIVRERAQHIETEGQAVGIRIKRNIEENVDRGMRLGEDPVTTVAWD